MLHTITHWLLTPLSGASEHEISPWISWHGRVMVLAWSVLLPLGVMGARFFKVLPGQDWPRVLDNKVWWHAHLTLQYGGVACTLLGVWLILGGARGGSVVALWHARAGWLVSALGVLQVLSGLLRGSKGGPTDVRMRGDHYDMTLRRVIFEWVHKCGGYMALLLAVFATFSGLVVADAPRWMVLVLLLWWMALIVMCLVLQKQGRCIDTWQAIWGPDDRDKFS